MGRRMGVGAVGCMWRALHMCTVHARAWSGCHGADVAPACCVVHPMGG